jgi:hypothetical protein
LSLENTDRVLHRSNRTDRRAMNGGMACPAWTKRPHQTLFILLGTVLIACNQRPEPPKPYHPEASGEASLPDCFTLYQDLFHTDSIDVEALGRCALITSTIGHLEIRSQRLVIGDPVILHDLAPLALPIPNGDHPIDLVQVVNPKHIGHRMNALIRLRLNDDPPVNWKYASTDSVLMDTTNVRSDDLHGFSVDAGSALLFDARQQKRLLELDIDRLWTDSAHVNTGVFSYSTNGDGLFPAYWGFNEQGEPCQLIIDLMVVRCRCT